MNKHLNEGMMNEWMDGQMPDWRNEWEVLVSGWICTVTMWPNDRHYK